MQQRQPIGEQTAERRLSQRNSSDSKVRVTFEAQEFEGLANNLSKTGVLFFTDEPVRVKIAIEQNGETEEFEGCLVRCDRIKGDHRGWAVEFDQD